MKRLRCVQLSALIVFAFLCTTGCAGYRFGPRSMFRHDIRTVHVPIFVSDTLRRGLGERLTEAVVKEIASRTPYKLVNADQADSVLRGRIVTADKNALTSNINGEPRVLDVNFQLQISWTDRQGNLLSGPIIYDIAPTALNINQSASFVPEGGQSLATAQQESIQRLARQVVSQMEGPW